jgi:hypothetical protein
MTALLKRQKAVHKWQVQNDSLLGWYLLKNYRREVAAFFPIPAHGRRLAGMEMPYASGSKRLDE